jgi:hypothetical protein
MNAPKKFRSLAALAVLEEREAPGALSNAGSMERRGRAGVIVAEAKENASWCGLCL